MRIDIFQMANNKVAFTGMVVFAEVVDSGGFSAAARALDHSVSHVSKEIARLERRLNTRLLNRTTRSISLTEDGRLYYEKCKQIIEDTKAAEQSILAHQDEPTGLLKVSAPVSLSLSHINAILPKFLSKNQKVKVNIEASDRKVDIVAEGYDLVIRAGHLPSNDLIARKLMDSRLLTVASPAYIRENGVPNNPADLADHSCISYALRQPADYWTYYAPSGDTLTTNVDPRVVCNSAEAEIALAVAGVGITRVPWFTCDKELADGSLEIILQNYESPPIGIYAVYPNRAHLAPKVRVFIDFLAEHIAG